MKFDEQLIRIRPLLVIEAKRIHSRKLQAGFDPSDVVQQTLVEALRGRHKCQADNSIQITGWLLQILQRNMIDAVRGNHRKKKDIDCEQSVPMIRRSIRLDTLLAASQSSPSEQMMRLERIVALAVAIEQLPDNWQQVVYMKHIESLSHAKIAELMETTQPAVAGMLSRALRRLREILEAS